MTIGLKTPALGMHVQALDMLAAALMCVVIKYSTAFLICQVSNYNPWLNEVHQHPL